MIKHFCDHCEKEIKHLEPIVNMHITETNFIDENKVQRYCLEANTLASPYALGVNNRVYHKECFYKLFK